MDTRNQCIFLENSLRVFEQEYLDPNKDVNATVIFRVIPGILNLIVNTFFFTLLSLNAQLRTRSINLPLRVLCISESLFGVRAVLFAMLEWNVVAYQMQNFVIMFIRCQDVMNPDKPGITTPKVRLICLIAIFITFLLTASALSLLHKHVSKEITYTWWGWTPVFLFSISHLISVFLLPFIIMTFMGCCIANRLYTSRRVPKHRWNGVKLTLALYTSYVFLSLPYWCWLSSGLVDTFSTGQLQPFLIDVLFPILFYSNTVVNVYIYYCFCKDLRRCVRLTFRCGTDRR